MTDPQAPQEQTEPEVTEQEGSSRSEGAGTPDEAALADAQPTTAMAPGGGTATGTGTGTDEGMQPASAPAEVTQATQAVQQGTAPVDASQPTQAVQPGSAPVEATQQMGAVPSESPPADATQVVRPGDVPPTHRHGQQHTPTTPAWGQRADGPWGGQAPGYPPPGQPGGFGAPAQGPPGVQAAFTGNPGGARTKGTIVAVAGGVLGVLGAVMAIITWILLSGKIAQQANEICGSLSGSIADQCRQSAHIPGSLIFYLIVIIIGGLVAAVAAALMYLRNKIGSVALVAGGVLIVLFNVIISVQYTLPWELFIALVCGILGLIIGVLAYLPQTSQALGLPSLLTARGSGSSAGVAGQSWPAVPDQFGAAQQPQWGGQPQQPPPQWGGQPAGPPPQWAGQPQQPPPQWGGQPQQPPPQWGGQPAGPPPQWAGQPQQQGYPPPQ